MCAWLFLVLAILVGQIHCLGDEQLLLMNYPLDTSIVIGTTAPDQEIGKQQAALLEVLRRTQSATVLIVLNQIIKYAFSEGFDLQFSRYIMHSMFRP